MMKVKFIDGYFVVFDSVGVWCPAVARAGAFGAVQFRTRAFL